ncbi:MAG: lamin tail domain-containing protein [Candidatus Marinimicrobia bacterium]|nr:lamin tail domain-containing protein [Candidatus Neomarinimicrobiota bacterium]
MKLSSIIVGSIVFISFLSAQVTTSYSWEDGGTILGLYGNLANPANVGATGGVEPYDGAAMLTVSESPVGDTPQAFIAFIENLSQDDVVTASFYGYDDTPNNPPSLRIWASYAANGDIDAYSGSASGNLDYTDGSGWSQLSYTWTIPADQEALVIQARLYSGTDDPTVYFIDLVSVTAPATANVTYPSPPSLEADAGSDQIVSVDASVTLDGSASTGSITSYSWAQIGTPVVTITNADAAIATFTAPATAAELQFELTIAEAGGATATDTVDVSVLAIGASPIIITEYIEGSSGNNKYLELYNSSDTEIDLIGEGYTLGRDDNGNQDFSYALLSDWGSLSILPAGAVIVLAADGHELYATPDTVLVYNSPVHFNGNDAVALMKNSVIVDMVGELGNSIDHIRDMTLRRLTTVTAGNPIFTWSEWTQHPPEDVSGLGGLGVGPAFTNIAFSPEFILDNTAINVQVDIIPADSGAGLATGLVAYGDNFLNTTAIYPSGDTWYGQIPASATTANSAFIFLFRVTDDDGVEYSSSPTTLMIASSTPMDIANIHTNISSLEGSIQTISGVVTIGTGLLSTSNTSGFIQDGSGRGLNLFDYGNTTPSFALGNEMTVVGEVDLYFTTVELVDFIYNIDALESTVPAPLAVSITDAVSQAANYEGTLIQLTGTVASNTDETTAYAIVLSDGGSGSADVRIWNSTGIDASQYTVGSTQTFVGVGSQYSDVFQLLIGYDAATYLTVEPDEHSQALQFALLPAYPNPFNPVTQMTWQVEQAGDYTLAVYNIMGQELGVLHHGPVAVGSYTTEWNAGHLSSGVYFVRLSGNGAQAIQKVMLLK